MLVTGSPSIQRWLENRTGESEGQASHPHGRVRQRAGGESAPHTRGRAPQIYEAPLRTWQRGVSERNRSTCTDADASTCCANTCTVPRRECGSPPSPTARVETSWRRVRSLIPFNLTANRRRGASQNWGAKLDDSRGAATSFTTSGNSKRAGERTPLTLERRLAQHRAVTTRRNQRQ
jgi:hypothetical protein